MHCLRSPVFGEMYIACMRKLSVVLFFMIAALEAYSQTGKQGQFFIDTINQARYFGSEGDSSVTFKMDTISEQQFNQIKYKSPLDTNSKRVVKKDTLFIVPLDQGAKAFASNGLIWHAYRGYIEALDLYVIDFVSGPGGYHNLDLIDKKTGVAFTFSSLFDNGMNSPLLSPKQGFLLSISNNVFDHNESNVAVVKINRKGNAYTLTNFYQRVSHEGHIEEIKWIDETSFSYKIVFTGESDYQTSFCKVSWK